ncbi:hypothetical protein Leryth_012191 [Lithospermum erythrorhizon]|nr:hypothetical protein Leryth_012191 [Lithospermum erythrorhizon]
MIEKYNKVLNSIDEREALFDSGSSFTMFPDAIYTSITDSFDSQVLDPRRNGSDLAFEYCYSLSLASEGFTQIEKILEASNS